MKFNHKYRDNTTHALTNAWVLVDFKFTSNGILIANDVAAPAVNTVQFSYDGAHLHGVVRQGETLAMTNNQHRQIYIRGSAGGEAYRLMVW